MMKPLNIKTEEAAALMQKNPLFVREAMKRDLINIGAAMQMPGSTKWNFYISPPLLAEYIGISLDDLAGMVQQIRGVDAVG